MKLAFVLFFKDRQKFILFFFVCISIIVSSTMYAIIPIFSFFDKDVSGAFEKADANTLVIFDLDFVLTYPGNDAAGMVVLQYFDHIDEEYREESRKIGEKFQRSAEQKYGNRWVEEMIIMESIAMETLITQVIEPHIVSMIQSLQQRGVKVLALTTSLPGKYCNKIRQQTRYEALKSRDIDFCVSFAQDKDKDIIFPLGLERVGDIFPAFYNGIFFTCANKKGVSLWYLLNYLKREHHWEPGHVIFFDDQKGHLDSVTEIMQALGISCQAFWYRALQEYYVDFDRENIEMRLKLLLEKTWIPADWAASMCAMNDR
jgi:hypothetical protein